MADASIWGTFLLWVAFRHVICEFYLFFFPVRFPSEIQTLPLDPPMRGFCGVWKLPLLWLPYCGRSLSLALLSLFLSCIFCPTSFWRQWAAFMGTWCLLLVVRSCFVKLLSVQMFFWWICMNYDEFEKVVSLSYSSTVLAPPGPLFDWIIYFSGIELQELLIYFGN